MHSIVYYLSTILTSHSTDIMEDYSWAPKMLFGYSLNILGAVLPVNSVIEVKNDPREKAISKKLK